MTGILKVDQWKDSGDNTLMTSDGVGNLTVNAPFSSTGIDDNATSTAITIDSSQRVGITEQINKTVNDSQLIIAGGNDSNQGGNILLYGPSASPANTIIYRQGTSEILRMDSEGLKIGGTTSANALDDYEEGTWTPALSGATTTTYNVQTGVYTKVGRIVTAHFELHINAKGNGNKALISGLPFSCQNQNGQSGCLGLYSGIAKSPNYLTMRMDNGSSSLDFAGTDSETSGLSFSYTIFDVNGARVIGSIQYTTS